MAYWCHQLAAVCSVVGFLALSHRPVAVRAQQTPLANRVPYPVQLTLAPGEAVTLYDANPAALPGVPANVPFALGDASVAVTNSTPDPLDVSADGMELTLDETAESALQLLQRVASDPTIPLANAVVSIAINGSPLHLTNCGATTTTAATVRCEIPHGLNATNVLAISAAAASGAERTAELQPGERATLLIPASGGDAPAIDVANNAREPLETTWDGQSLAATVADGYILSGSISPTGKFSRMSATHASCSAEGALNVLFCPLTGVPAVEVSLTATTVLSSMVRSLDYSDAAGTGTLTLTPNGADPASGGEAVAAVLSRAGVAFTGGGVLRPWEDSGDIAIALSLTGADGSPLLLEGALRSGSGAYGGQGYTLSPSRDPVEDRWSAAGASFPDDDFQAVLALAVDISSVTTDSYGNQGFGGLGQFAGQPGQPLDFASLHIATIGKPGEPVSLDAQLDTPDPAVTGDAHYSFDFGDGSPLASVGSLSKYLPGESGILPHTYTQPGIYTVIVYRDDDTGVRTFGVARLRIAAAGS